jgi:ABC-type sugar transport system substrate-binding protein
MQWQFRLPLKRQSSAEWKVGQSWGGLLGVLLVAAAVTSNSGCDSGSFMPPPPDDLRGASGVSVPAGSSVPRSDRLETAPTEARSVELILGRHDPDEADAVKTTARMQAGYDKVKLKIESLGEQDLPARQAELVRQALSRNPLALVVEPADPAERHLAEAIQEARAQGVPVVLLNRPLTGDRPTLPGVPDQKAETGKGSALLKPGRGTDSTPTSRPVRPIVLVAPVGFRASADQLVNSAIRNAKNAKLKPEGGAVLLIDSGGDSFIEDRATAIRAALKASLIPTVEEIRFSKSVEVGAKLLTERLRANPKLVMVFSVDSLTSGASRHVMSQILLERPFVLAGYASEENYAEMTRIGDYAAIAEFAPLRVVRKAINTAVSLAQGRDLPGRIEIPINVTDSPEGSGLPQSPAYAKARSDAEKKGS